MEIRYCPNCGVKRTPDGNFCTKCMFDFHSVRITEITNEYKTKKSSSTKGYVLSIVSYLTNGIFLFWSVWIYLISREMVSRGGVEGFEVIVLPLLVSFLFYIPSVIIFYKRGGYALWVTSIITLLMLVPEFILLIDFREFAHAVGEIYGDIDFFLFVSAVPIFFSIVICMINVVVIILRTMKKNKQEVHV